MLRSVVLLSLLAAPLPAALITLTGIDSTRGGNVEILENGTPTTVFAGAIDISYDGGATLKAFCVDLFTDISLSSYTSDPYLPAPWRSEDRAAWLFVTYLASVDTVAEGQALQLALWDVVHDGGDGLAAGSIRASVNTPSDVQTQFGIYLSSSLGQSSFAATIYHNVETLTGQPVQRLISTFQPGSQTSVPEPSTLALVTAGCLAAAWQRKRTRRPRILDLT